MIQTSSEHADEQADRDLHGPRRVLEEADEVELDRRRLGRQAVDALERRIAATSVIARASRRRDGPAPSSARRVPVASIAPRELDSVLRLVHALGDDVAGDRVGARLAEGHVVVAAAARVGVADELQRAALERPGREAGGDLLEHRRVVGADVGRVEREVRRPGSLMPHAFTISSEMRTALAVGESGALSGRRAVVGATVAVGGASVGGALAGGLSPPHATRRKS